MPTRLLVCIVFLPACLQTQMPDMNGNSEPATRPSAASAPSTQASIKRLDAMKATAWSREAIAVARQAVMQHPSDANVLARAARVFRLAGMLREAESAAMAADVDQCDEMSLVELIVVASASGHDQKAREAEQTLHERLADKPKALAALDNLLTALGASSAPDNKQTRRSSRTVAFGACPLHRDEDKANALYVEGSINNHEPIRLYIDSGHGRGITLPQGAIAMYDLDRGEATSSHTVLGTRRQVAARAASIAMGDIALAAVDASVMQDGGDDDTASIGLAVFDPHCVTLDLGRMSLEVREEKTSTERPHSKWRLPFWYVRSLIIVPIHIDAEQHRAGVIDTGSSRTLVSRRLASDAGWRLEDQSEGATLRAFGRSQFQPATVAKNVSFKLGDMRLAFDSVYVDDIVTQLLSADELGVGVDIVVGMDVIAKFDRVSVDYTRQTIELLPK